MNLLSHFLCHCLHLRWVGAALAVCVVAGGPGLAVAAPATPAQVFEQYLAAVKAQDKAAVAALIADEVERNDFPACRPEMSHKQCLMLYIDATVLSQSGQITVLDTQVQGDTVSANLALRSELTRRAGVERVLGVDVVRVREGRIVAFRFVPDFSDPPTRRFFATLGIGPGAH
ncbi:nuclear transport factor 2 family protein [Curvibacter sp. HBC61]|uniref:Nuclear transport factor 2 family protein n=1 Tax=Curvibacter cyanobacteriorum TaxID=3026422 RepID=A0ABT5MYC3_9BURK|nr:nuclear transport factor 2 family protein [Curvibacter sp. HBC61]MDD0838880.1 nuclear transport factor 2 family protein [Curvibacter sp. HBC61]